MSQSKFIIYHNPRCSKSRQTLAILEENKVDVEIREYLKTPPSVADIKKINNLLGGDLSQMVRSKETVYSELNLRDASEDRVIDAMHHNPILLERPIVIHDAKAVIGRPPENVNALFNT